MEQSLKMEGRVAEIAAAARTLIAERGFEGLRTRDIAAHVGINVATLHYHVPTKEALIGLVARSIREHFIDQNRKRPRDGLSPRALLELEFVDFRETFFENEEVYAAHTELIERARRDPNVAAHIEPMKRYWYGQIVSILERGRSAGQFRADLDPRAGALIVIGSLVASQRHPERSPELFAQVCQEILRALGAAETSERSPDARP